MTKMIGGATATYWEKIQTEEYYKELLEKKKEEQEAIQDRSEDAVIQTGASSYTQKQWNSMLKNFDEIAENSREEMRIRHEKMYEKQIEREERARNAVMENYIKVVQEAKRNRERQLQEQYLKKIFEEKVKNS